MKGIKLQEIPEKLLMDVTRQVFDYSVGILSVVADKNGCEEIIIKGSGTLISIDGLYGILTAAHVIEYLPKTGKIGFVISERLHTFTINGNILKMFQIAKSKNPADGPDVGLILLPAEVIGQFKASKSFYNIGKRVKNNPEIDLGLWGVFGFPEMLIRHEGPDRNFDKIKGIVGFFYFADLVKFFCLEEFDYYDFEIINNINTPVSLEGVSGGGLWQVIMSQNASKELVIEQIILSGIPYYQSEYIDQTRQIRCHGRKTIYQHVIKFMKMKNLWSL